MTGRHDHSCFTMEVKQQHNIYLNFSVAISLLIDVHKGGGGGGGLFCFFPLAMCLPYLSGYKMGFSVPLE